MIRPSALVWLLLGVETGGDAHHDEQVDGG
jgi:hypothetical protein